MRKNQPDKKKYVGRHSAESSPPRSARRDTSVRKQTRASEDYYSRYPEIPVSRGYGRFSDASSSGEEYRYEDRQPYKNRYRYEPDDGSDMAPKYRNEDRYRDNEKYRYEAKYKDDYEEEYEDEDDYDREDDYEDVDDYEDDYEDEDEWEARETVYAKHRRTVPPQPSKPGKPGIRRGTKAKIALRLLLIVFLLLFAGVTYAGYSVTHRQTILPNVCVGGIPLGNMTREQAAVALKNAGWDTVSARKLEVTLMNRVSFAVDPCEAGCRFTLDDGVEAAFHYGHTGNWYRNLAEYLRCLIRPVDMNDVALVENRAYVLTQVDAAVSTLEQELGDGSYTVLEDESVLRLIKGAAAMQFDREAMADAILTALRANQSQLSYDSITNSPPPPDFHAIHEQLSVEAADAYFTDDNTFTVIDHVIGCDFSPEEAGRLWEAAPYAAAVDIPLSITTPEVTSEALHALLYRDLLGASTTYYRNSIDNRINNLNLAASKINGLILYPGDVFSYNEILGQRTQEAGFLPAGAYENGEVVEEVGGGICQVSSTLYSAMLYGYNLTTVERSPHYFPVDYLEKGYDATVSWPKPDFKFRNDRDYPIKIVATCNNEERSLTVEIWGTNLDGHYISLRKDTRAYSNAKYTWIMEGYGVQVFRDVIGPDGVKVDQINEIYDIYHTHEATEQIKALDAQAAQAAALDLAMAALGQTP